MQGGGRGERQKNPYTTRLTILCPPPPPPFVKKIIQIQIQDNHMQNPKTEK